MEENIRMLRTRYALTSIQGNSLRRSRFSLRRSSDAGLVTVGDSEPTGESPTIQNGPTGMSEIVGIPLTTSTENKLETYSVSSALSATDAGSSSSASDANSDTHSSDGNVRIPSHNQEVQQSKNVSCEGIAMISSDCSTSLNSLVEDLGNIATGQNDEKPATLQRNDTIRSSKSHNSSLCQIDRSFSDDLEELDMLLEVPLSPLETYQNHDNGGRNGSINDDDGFDTKKKSRRVRVTTVKLSKLPKAVDELCTLFRIKTEAIFTGGSLIY
jgi:hypothetical protein